WGGGGALTPAVARAAPARSPRPPAGRGPREAPPPPPPISLPGRPASAAAVATPPPPKLRPPPQLECASTLCRREAEPDDHRLPYSQEELLVMDRRFTERLERAFALGLESRTSAGRRLRR